MRHLILLTLLTFYVPILSQDYELPKMKEYDMGWYWWPDTISANQKEFWPNGNLKVEYLSIGNNKKLKKEYFEEGNLKLTAEVYQVYTIDTILVEAPITYKLEEVVEKGFKDIADGKYVEYKYFGNHPWKEPFAFGQYKNGKQFGQWKIEIDGLDKLVVANFNNEGNLEGKYIEYFFVLGKYEGKIKWEGQFEIFEYNFTVWDHAKKKYVPGTSKKSRKVGVWKRYNKDGKLIETVTYKRIKQ